MLLLAVARDILRQGTISRTCRAREFDLLILTVKKMYFGLIPPCLVYSILLTHIHKNHRGTLASFLIDTRPTGAGQDVRLFGCGKVYMAYGVGRALFGSAPAYATGSL